MKDNSHCYYWKVPRNGQSRTDWFSPPEGSCLVQQRGATLLAYVDESHEPHLPAEPTELHERFRSGPVAFPRSMHAHLAVSFLRPVSSTLIHPAMNGDAHDRIGGMGGGRDAVRIRSRRG